MSRLSECHPDLQTLFQEVIKHFDCTVICGHRGEEAQNVAYEDGFSTKLFPNSKHNRSPSLAVDVVPYPINWKDTDRMRYFAGYVMGVAKMLKRYNAIEREIVSGLDWDGDTDLSDQRLKDAPHFQIK